MFYHCSTICDLLQPWCDVLLCSWWSTRTLESLDLYQLWKPLKAIESLAVYLFAGRAVPACPRHKRAKDGHLKQCKWRAYDVQIWAGDCWSVAVSANRTLMYFPILAMYFIYVVLIGSCPGYDMIWLHDAVDSVNWAMVDHAANEWCNARGLQKLCKLCSRKT